MYVCIRPTQYSMRRQKMYTFDVIFVGDGQGEPNDDESARRQLYKEMHQLLVISRYKTTPRVVAVERHDCFHHQQLVLQFKRSANLRSWSRFWTRSILKKTTLR